MKRPTSRYQQKSGQGGEFDDRFFDRADAVIDLVNEQLADINPGRASASVLYAAARFNAWMSATGHGSAEDMAAAKAATVDYFVEQYRVMLEENLEDYIGNFDRYMRPTN